MSSVKASDAQRFEQNLRSLTITRGPIRPTLQLGRPCLKKSCPVNAQRVFWQLMMLLDPEGLMRVIASYCPSSLSPKDPI